MEQFIQVVIYFDTNKLNRNDKWAKEKEREKRADIQSKEIRV